MANLSRSQCLRLAGKGIWNYIANRPLVVSFEVTLSCNCNCCHCDLGGVVKDEKQIPPPEYKRITRLLKPPVVQISGGEPLLRRDIMEVVKAVKQPGGLPYVIFVTNGVLLNEDNYLELCEAGVNQFSVSLDFPDKRHDDFRRHSGLYERLERTIPRLAKFGYRNIILNTVITRNNLDFLLPVAKKALEWGVCISYSAYTMRRTGSKDYCLDTEEELGTLRKAISELLGLQKKTDHIVNPEAELRDTLKFFEQGGYMPGCKAGIRFLVVMPDGAFVPCAHHRQKYSSVKEMMKGFSKANRCGDCYVSIRAYSDRPLWSQLKAVPAYGRRLFAFR